MDKKESNIPRLSHEDIELKAEEIIEYFDKSVLQEPKPTPLSEFIDLMTLEFKIGFDTTQDLGSTPNGKKILGAFRFNPRFILIDKSVVNTNRFYFTLGHELGHLVFHRNIVIKRENYEADGLVDTKKDLVTGKKILLTERDWIEWQANKFSSCLMMPRATVRDAIVKIQTEIGIKRNVGIIFLDNNNYSFRDYNAIIDQLKLIYRLNKTNIEFRLKDLGILIDRRDKNVSHISELFKEE